MFNGCKWKINTLHCLDQVFSLRVDGNTVICDNYVYALARRGYCSYICTDRRCSSLKKRCDNNCTFGTCRCIRMTTLGTGDHTVGVYNDIAVKVYVHLKGCKNYEIQLVDNSTFVKGVRILSCTDAEVMEILYRLYGCKVEILGIQKCIYLTIDQQLAHRLGKSTHTKSHTHATFFHDFCKRDGRCDRCTTYTSLVRKSIFEIRSIYYKLSTVICHHQLTHICGRFCCTSCNLVWITDLIHCDYIIHICHGNMCREVRERNHTVCDGNYVVCILGICHRIGKHTTVGFSADTTTVSIFVAGRSSDESNINLCFACYQCTDTSAMGTHDGKTF